MRLFVFDSYIQHVKRIMLFFPLFISLNAENEFGYEAEQSGALFAL